MHSHAERGNEGIYHMSKWRKILAKKLDPGLMDAVQVAAMVSTEVRRASQSKPIQVDFDPKNEGYRKLSGSDTRRDLNPITQDRMFEIAYFMYDSSGMTKRFVRDTRNFVMGEGVTYEVENDESGAAKEILDDFWKNPANSMDLRLGKKVEFLGLLGEQCWPVVVNPYNGAVTLSYIDPVNIKDVATLAGFPEICTAVYLKGQNGRKGKQFSIIRQDTDPRFSRYGRLVGDCFFFSINNPPNSPRGRSDLIQSFDFINGFEEGLFSELDRVQLIKSFVWDVLMEGATEEEIIDFIQKNKTPKPGSLRVHNERVKWSAVAPTLNASDNKAFLDSVKSYLAGCQNRPDSWFGAGGKAYQSEADLMGEPTFKDLGERQRYVKYMIEYMLTFVLDQAIIYGALRPHEDGYKISVAMPEPSTKDTANIAAGLASLATALMVAETQKWITRSDAAQVYASVATRLGVSVDPLEDAEINEDITDDYEKNPPTGGLND